MPTDPETEMRVFCDKVIAKVISRNNKPGNSPTPWKEFGTGHLRERLKQEIREWKESLNEYEEQDELIDVAAMSMFIYLSIAHDREYLFNHSDRRGGVKP